MLEHTWDEVDLLSCHARYGNPTATGHLFWPRGVDMDAFIER